jgi:hypothetical protein
MKKSTGLAQAKTLPAWFPGALLARTRAATTLLLVECGPGENRFEFALMCIFFSNF